MIRFLVFGDLHYDHIPDGKERVQELAEAIREERPDFVLSLGDLCSPVQQNLSVRRALESADCPIYYVLGNHDGDQWDLCTTTDFFSLSRSWYSFIVQDVKFIVLYAGFIQKGDEFIPFQRSDYDKTADQYPVLPDEELDWLRKEMEDKKQRYVICSHQSLANDFARRGIANREKIRGLLDQRNTLLCLNGHDHGNAQVTIQGIPYVTINTASYFWHGTQKVHSYAQEIHAKYPILEDVLLIENALYAIVQIDGEEIRIRGRKSRWQTLSPKQINLTSRWNGVTVAAEIPDYIWKTKDRMKKACKLFKTQKRYTPAP